MTEEKNKINIFKPYLTVSIAYKGGKSKKALSESGKKIYKLSSNENLYGTSPKAIQAIKDNIDSLNEYPDSTGVRLQQALEKFYNHEMGADQFITAPSGSEVLELIIRAFLGEGLECIISNPTFLPYRMFSEKMGAVIRDVPLQLPDYSLDTEGILSAINEKTRLLFLTTPNNPTGSYIPKDILEDLISKVPGHVVIVLDEVYYQFAEATDYCNAQHFVRQGKNVIGLNSFSKAYGMAGLRMGYAYSTSKLATYIMQLAKPFMINTLSMEAAIAALEDDDFIAKTASLIREERKYLYEELDKIGIQYWKTEGNFFLTKPIIPEKEFEAKMLEEGVMVRPVTNFGAPGCIRITIGDREANEACIKAITKIYSNSKSRNRNEEVLSV